MRRLVLPVLLLLVARASAEDAAGLRREILERMDRRIDEEATRAHLDARRLLDEVLPVPYLGIDADPAEGGMRVTKVYPRTGAAAAGLRPGDLLLAIGGDRTDSRETLGRLIRSRKPGSEMEFRIRREGAEETLRATLGRRPEEDEDEEEQFPGLAGAAVPPLAALRLDFAQELPGATPSRLEPILAGHGRPGRWSVVEEEGARFLRQEEPDDTGIRFPIALVREAVGENLAAKVRFRFRAGDIDRAAGIVLRFRDAGSYLLARVNAVEGDLRIFRAVQGLRRTLPGARVAVACDDRAWHTLEFRAEGPKLTAVFDGGPGATSYDTFLPRGRIGLWTKSDAVTDFDDLAIDPAAKSEPG